MDPGEVTFSARIAERGQVTVPAHLRKALDLRRGDIVEVSLKRKFRG